MLIEYDLTKIVNKSLSKEIISEYKQKERSYWKLIKKHSPNYSWIFDNKVILNLIFVSVFYRRVIHPMEETVKFYKLINDPLLYEPNTITLQKPHDITLKKIRIGISQIDKGDDLKQIDVNIHEIQKIITDFEEVSNIFDIPSKIFFYNSIDEFLQNLKLYVGVNNE
ncbi:MAG: hypothetical protein WC626_07345 [Methanoregula sp.]